MVHHHQYTHTPCALSYQLTFILLSDVYNTSGILSPVYIYDDKEKEKKSDEIETF